VSLVWDEAAWGRLGDELARWAPATATLWWRDDDAGDASPALERLLALADATGCPLALAVVPAWLTPAGVAAIRRAPPAIHVFQHGYAHADHEPAPVPPTRQRKAELGAGRPAPVVLAELAAGWARLAQQLPERLRAVLVPPWNRIAPAVCAALPGAGYRMLSTFGPRARAEPAPGLRALNCHVDPIRWREDRQFVGATTTLDQLAAHLAGRRQRRVDPDEPTGLLTHHREWPEPAWTFLARLLPRLRAHPAVAFPAIGAAG